MNAFALDLYAALIGREGGSNVFCSPYSAFVVLAIAAEGARGETADEMGTALHLPESMRRQGPGRLERPWDFAPLHLNVGEMTRSFAQSAQEQSDEVGARADALRARSTAADEAGVRAMKAGDYQTAFDRDTEARRLRLECQAIESAFDRPVLLAANALWGEASYPFAAEFLDVIDRHYGPGTVRSENFRHEPEAARHRINEWAADNTARRIQDVVAPGVVHTLTRLMITNAVYFKGEWSDPFGPWTRPAPFLTADGNSTPVPLMSGGGDVRYGAFHADGRAFPTPETIRRNVQPLPSDPKYYPGSGGFQVAEIDYKGGDTTMVVVLPTSPDGLVGLEQQLKADRLHAWTAQLRSRPVHLQLPKFRITSTIDLSRDLKALGIRLAFVNPVNGIGADFSGMTSSRTMNEAIFVDAIVQKSFVQVHELGTEAAAVTYSVAPASARPPETRPFVPTFRADRPFLLFIRHVPTGLVLFMGRYARPSAGEPL